MVELILFCIVLSFAAFTLGYAVGYSFADLRFCRLQRENYQLKQMLADMRRIEEIGYKAYCAMSREAAHKQQSALAPSTKTTPPNAKKQ